MTDLDARVMASENRYTPLEYDLSHDPKPDIIPHLATIVRCWVLQIPKDQLTNLALKYEQDQKMLELYFKDEQFRLLYDSMKTYFNLMVM